MTHEQITQAIAKVRAELDRKTAECNHLQGYVHALQDLAAEMQAKPEPLVMAGADTAQTDM